MTISAQRCIPLLAALLSLLATSPAQAQTLVKPSSRPAATYGQVPLHFEPNVGQADASVTFVARGPGYSIALQPATATITLHHPPAKTSRPGAALAQAETVRLTMLHANPTATMAAQQPSSTYVNYMAGSDRKDWHLGVPTSLQARTTSLYNGIDVVYYGSQRNLEYDFTVAAGADPTLIRMAVTGAEAKLDADGSLRLQTSSSARAQDLRFGKPVLYQQVNGKRLPVDGSFAVAANGEVGFTVGAYDHAQQLVIDPIISYASYFGGAGEDEINASALNASGQLYAVGQTYSTALPGTTGEFQAGRTANKNGHAAFVTKFSADGSTILWTTYLEGTGDDFATGVAVGAADQPYVVGYTSSCGDGGLSYATAGEFPFVAGGAQPLCNADVRGFNNYESNGAGYDAFVVKLSSDGKAELAGSPLGGTATDVANSVALDAAGKVYVVGQTYSTQYFYAVSSNLRDVPSYPVNQHGVASIGTANFPTTSSAFYINTTESKANSTTDSSGNVSGPQDEQAFLTVLSADLSTITYSSLLGGPVLGGCGNGNCNTNGIAVAVNTNDIAYIGGNTSSAHWPVTAGAIAGACANAGASSSQCPMTGWLAAFDPTKSGTASLLFNTYVNGQSAGKSGTGTTNYPGSDVYGLTTDTTGNVVATGDTNAVDFPTTAGTLQPACSKFNDGNGNVGVCEFEGFVAKVSSAGALQWSTYLGPTTGDIANTAGRGVALDSNSNVYVLATTGSNSLPLKNSLSATVGGNPDYYVAELNPTASTLLLGTYMGIGGGFSPNNNSLAIDSASTVYFGGSQAPNPYGGTSFPVTANAADKTIQGADGFVVKLITQQQSSATALAVSPSGTATPSQTVTLTATLTTPSTLTGTRLPTGTVTFLNGTTVIGTSALNASGVATYTGTLASGAYNITASYPGDVAFLASVSTTTPLTVSSAVVTTTTETVAPATSTFGSPEVFTAKVVAGTAPVTSGTVTFTAGAITLGTATVNAKGIATVTVAPAVGVYSVVANYAGTYNQTTNPSGYGPSVSAGAPLTVTRTAATTVTLTSSSATVGTNATFTLTATVPAAATGTVTFNNGTVALGTATVANGVATLSTSLSTAATYSLTAAYSGDINFAPGTSTALTLTVVVPGFTVSASPSSLTITRGSTGVSTLTFTPVGGYSGTLTLACGSLPTNATCTFSPATVTLSGSVTTSTVTIGTGSQSAKLDGLALPGRGPGPLTTSLASFLPGSVLALLAFTRRRKIATTFPLLGVLALATLALVGTLTGCGGSSSNSGANTTPAGAYTVNVTISGGTSPAQTVPLSITVQ